jgi:hypothetical protein
MALKGNCLNLRRWETVGVKKFVPQIGDTVTTTTEGHNGSFVITGIDREGQTADLKSLPASGASTYVLVCVTWNDLRPVDAARSNLQIVRESA